MSDREANNKKSKIPTIVVILVGFIVIGLWLLAFNELWFFDWRKFSDYQESLTSLFAGLALVFVAWTAFMQREELNQTRAVMTQQAETMELQRFETTFFNMLNNFNEKRKNLYFSAPYPDLTKTKNNNDNDCNALSPRVEGVGVNAFEAIYTAIEGHFYYCLLSELKNVPINTNSNFYSHKKEIIEQLKLELDAKEKSKSAFLSGMSLFYKNHSFDYGAYYNYFKHIIDFFDKSTRSLEKKQFYFDTILFNLTKYEIAFFTFFLMEYKNSSYRSREDDFLDRLIFYKIIDVFDFDLLLEKSHKHLILNINLPPHTTSPLSQ